MKILDRLPFSADDCQVSIPTGLVSIRAYQIIVTVSLAFDKTISRPFPAVLDTGLNQNFALAEEHLEDWLAISTAKLRLWGYSRSGGQMIPLKRADVMVHRNIPGKALLANAEPYRMQLSDREGILLFPRNKGPRLPLLGLRSLVHSRLSISVDGNRKTVTLRTNGWW